eukprot:302701-Pyramimonas_sp.AAC.1
MIGPHAGYMQVRPGGRGPPALPAPEQVRAGHEPDGGQVREHRQQPSVHFAQVQRGQVCGV